MKNVGLLFGALVITVAVVVGIAVLFSSKTNAPKPQPPVNAAQYLQSERNVRGVASASATLVEFSDFQCPSCKAVEPLVEQLEQVYPQQLKVVYRYFPLRNLHPNSAIAARAAEAATKQGTFWVYHDLLFAKQEDWAQEKDPTPKFVQYAKDLHLNTDQFSKDLQDSALDQNVSQDEQDGLALGVNATPTFYLNGRQVEIDALQSAVQNAIPGK